MLSPRRAVMAVFCTALLLGLAWGCAASNDASSSGNPGGGGTSGIGEAGNDEQILRPDGSGEAGEGSLGLSLLCGKSPRCTPDLAYECAGYVPPTVAVDASTDSSNDGPATLSSQAGQSGEGGASGAASSSAAGQTSLASAGEGGATAAGGSPGLAGSSGSEAGSSAAGAGGAPIGPAPEFSCQLQRTADPGAVVAQCAVVGTGGVNAPCLSSSDCGLDSKLGALGCVGDASSGLCEPYCCKGDDTCAMGSYCAERPLRDALTNSNASAPSVMIPVCVPAENCDLSTPYPCPTGTECACKSGMACVVVRADGTTTCAVPGSGAVGDACPCAWGNVCSVATNRCLKLCKTRDTMPCGTGACQASAELPEGWGVCVGAS